MLKQENSGRNNSILWVLMPWLLAWPGHGQPWYWLYRMNGSLSFMRKNLNYFNTLRPRQNGRRFADDTFKCIFLNGNVRISIKISLKFVPKGPINNNPALVQIMAWHQSGDKPLSEPMMVSLLMHICVTRPQWVNKISEIIEIANISRT